MLSRIFALWSGEGFGWHHLRLIEWSHVHVASRGPGGSSNVAQPCCRQVEARLTIRKGSDHRVRRPISFIRFFCRFALLIVDEIGYLPVIPGGRNLFFQLVMIDPH